MNFKIFLLSIVFVAAVAAGYMYMNSLQPEAPEVAVSPESLIPSNLDTEPPAAVPKTPTHRVIRDLPSPGANPMTRDESEESSLPPIVDAPTSLDSSDDEVKKAVGDISQPIVEWLVPDALIQKWVLLVKSAADGKVIVKNRPVNLKLLPFVVVDNGGDLSVGNNEERATQLVEAITKIDTQLLARYYKAWLPMFESAYQQLGESGSFDTKFQQAIVNVLNTDPAAAKNAELVRPSVYYKFVDKKLEKATELEKCLWRLGPENTERLQQFLRELRSAIQS